MTRLRLALAALLVSLARWIAPDEADARRLLEEPEAEADADLEAAEAQIQRMHAEAVLRRALQTDSPRPEA